MKQIKLIAIIMIICIVSVMMIPNVYAASESFELQLQSSSSTLHPGDTFSVNIYLDKINVTSGDKGIGAYQAKIVYDTNILELVSASATTGWEVLENEGNMVANTSNAEVVKERTATATISFKVLDNATLGNTTISLESIEGSSGTSTIEGTGVSTTIRVEEKSTDNENPSGDDNTVGNDNTAGGSNTNRNQISTSSNTSTTSNKVLPYAGLRNAIIIVMGIVIVATVVFYIKYKRAV